MSDIKSKSEFKRVQAMKPEVTAEKYFEMKEKLRLATNALEFYGHYFVWEDHPFKTDDGGETARKALEKIKS